MQEANEMMNMAEEGGIESKKRTRKTASNSSPSKKLKICESIPDNSRHVDMTSLAANICAGRYRKVVFLVGAGISVNAGIPDFRSPKSGLYAQVKKMGLPHPEDIFTLDCFFDDPRAFYNIAKMFFRYEAHPTEAHRLMKAFETRRFLHMVYTQNIDGLEVDVGLSEKKLVQAHGHMRSAHCCRCKTEYSMTEFFEQAENDQILYCSKCQDQSHGIIKPDIIFFGEKLPRTFHSRVQKIQEADLIFVMGTSMKVKPFSTILNEVPTETPIVVINRELPAPCDTKSMQNKKESKLKSNFSVVTNNAETRQIYFFGGDIEETVLEFKQYLQW